MPGWGRRSELANIGILSLDGRGLKVRVIFPRPATLLSAVERSLISFKRCLPLRNGSNLLVEQCNANELSLTESVAWCQFHPSGEFDCLYLGRFVHLSLLITGALPLSG